MFSNNNSPKRSRVDDIIINSCIQTAMNKSYDSDNLPERLSLCISLPQKVREITKEAHPKLTATPPRDPLPMYPRYIPNFNTPSSWIRKADPSKGKEE